MKSVKAKVVVKPAERNHMFSTHRLIVTSLLVVLLFSTALAQESRSPIDTPREPDAPTAPLVTATATAKRVRFVSPGTVVQLRLEVYNETGQKLFDTELHGGNVLDWHLQDGAGGRLPEGSYACVLTIKSLSGRLSQRVGLVTVNDKKATIEAAGAAQLSMAQQQTIGPVEGNAAFTVLQQSEAEAITAVTHDGTDGQVGRTRGAFSFRVGDFFSGKDMEQMRLTEEGNLGIGTDNPQSKLDVAGDIRSTGTIRAERIEFADGSVQTSGQSGKLDANGQSSTDVTGTGTANQVTKWLNNSGTLVDSAITEVSGKVGIGTTNPNFEITLSGNDVGVQIVSPSTGTTASDGFRFGITSTNQAFLFNQEATDMFFGTGATERMRIKANGTVGIGTSSPNAATKLDVVGDINTSTQYRIGGQRVLTSALGPTTDNVFAGVLAGQSSLNTGTDNSFFGVAAGGSNTTGSFNAFVGRAAGFQNKEGSSNVFVGNEAGNFNNGGSNNTIVGAEADVSNANLTNATAIGYRAKVSQSNSLVLGSNIVGGGTRVGIDTTAPTHSLTVGEPEPPVIANALTGVYGSGRAYSIVRDTTNNVEGLFGAEANKVLYGAMTDHLVEFRTNNTTRMRIFTDGVVEIGDFPSVSRDLLVNGKIFLHTNAGTDGNISLCTQPFNGGGFIVRCSSSLRYKTDVRGFTPGLDFVSRLRPVTFRWKQSGREDVGLVAEEVERVEPLLVTRNDKGEVEGVKYDRIGVVLLNAVREQQAQIKMQQQQLQAKDARITNLEARLTRYDARLASLDQRLRRGRTAHHAKRRSRR